MSCKCTQESDLPQIIPSNQSSCQPCPDECVSTTSEGSTLASSWLDAVCCATGLTLLARVGDKLARLAGTGFIKIENGIASVVSSVPLRSTVLWHRWWKSTPAAPPQIGEPLPFPYQVIADGDGNHRLIKGVGNEKSLSLWDDSTGEFTQTPVSEIPHEVKGPLLRASNIELVGYAPIAEDGDVAAVRSEKALSGSGIVVLTEAATVNNACEDGVASKATTLALPEPVADETYTLKYSAASGLYWSEDS